MSTDHSASHFGPSVWEKAFVLLTIETAIQQLGESRRLFGDRPQIAEAAFRDALIQRLDSLTHSEGWTWCSEAPFTTNALTSKNKRLPSKTRIKIDVMGFHNLRGAVAIELKYVPVHSTDKGRDMPRFPWDIAMDCLRLDLISAGRTNFRPSGGGFRRYVVAMTDFPDYWNGRDDGRWSKDFWKALGGDRTVRLEGLIRTSGRANPHNTIYKQGRCHIAFGAPWIGAWHHYCFKDTFEFRYLLLRPESEIAPSWKHDAVREIPQDSIVPFLNEASRQSWHEKFLR